MFDFMKFASWRGLHVQTSGKRSRPGWVQLECPVCGTDGTHGGWYLGWNLEVGCFNCWRCGKMDFKETLGRLLRTRDVREINSVIAQFQTDKRPERREIRARPRKLPPPKDYGPLLPQHRRYLEGRNYDPDELSETWGVAGCGPRGGTWAWRVVIPVHNAKGNVVAWQGRHIGTVEPKYRFTPDEQCLEDPKTLLYGLDAVEGDTVLVVEGVPSVWRIGPGAVATFGIDFKQEQFHLLRRFKRRFVAFDPEPAAGRRAEQLAAQLAVFPGETEILGGYSVQPSELPEDEILALRQEIGLR